MDIIDSIMSKIGAVLFILFIIVLIYSAIDYKLSEKRFENHEKRLEEINEEIKILEEEQKKYEEYKEFLKSNNFENNYSMEDNAKELELCNEFLEKNPGFDDMVFSQKAWLLIELEKYDEALKICEILINKNPDNKLHINKLAECYAGINNREKAFELLENKYKKEEKDMFYYLTLGRIYFILKDYDKAIENFSVAVKLDKSNPYRSVAPYYNRTKAYKKINDIKKYNSDMEEIEKIKENARKKIAELRKQKQDN